MKMYMGIDQYGYHYDGLKNPRKDLIAAVGGGKVSKMYVDGKDGGAFHVGYVIGKLWITMSMKSFQCGTPRKKQGKRKLPFFYGWRVTTMKQIKFGLGRFGHGPWMDFLRDLAVVNRKSREATAGELSKAAVEMSIKTDLKPKVKPHEHGLDVKSIAQERIEDIEEVIRHELVDAEIEALETELKLIDAFAKKRREYLNKLSGDRLGDGYSRQREIDEIRRKREAQAASG